MVLSDYADLNNELTTEDKQNFDEILQPVMKIYGFVKYVTTVIAAIFLVFAGISYMTSGNDPRKRDEAKSVVSYVIIGVLIIWATPMIINVLL